MWDDGPEWLMWAKITFAGLLSGIGIVGCVVIFEAASGGNFLRVLLG